MTDTPQHIKDLQLKIWLSKTPMERLHQFMTDNEALLKFCSVVKATGEKGSLMPVNKVENKTLNTSNQNIQKIK